MQHGVDSNKLGICETFAAKIIIVERVAEEATNPSTM